MGEPEKSADAVGQLRYLPPRAVGLMSCLRCPFARDDDDDILWLSRSRVTTHLPPDGHMYVMSWCAHAARAGGMAAAVLIRCRLRGGRVPGALTAHATVAGSTISGRGSSKGDPAVARARVWRPSSSWLGLFNASHHPVPTGAFACCCYSQRPLSAGKLLLLQQLVVVAAQPRDFRCRMIMVDGDGVVVVDNHEPDLGT